MSQCKFCGKKGLFMSIDNNGLCKDCSPIVIQEITQRLRILEDSTKLAQTGKTFQTRLSRCDLALEHLKELIKYEKKDIPTIEPGPTQMLKEFSSIREKIIKDETLNVAKKAITKSNLATTSSKKYSALSTGFLKVREIYENSKTPVKNRKIEIKLKSLMHKAKLNGFLDAAKKAEFKGNKKKAIDQYQEALYFIKTDKIPDEKQKQTILYIEKKLKELKS